MKENTQTWGDIPFWIISQPNVDGFCSNMGHFKKTHERLSAEPVSLSVRRAVFFVSFLTLLMIHEGTKTAYGNLTYQGVCVSNCTYEEIMLFYWN